MKKTDRKNKEFSSKAKIFSIISKIKLKILTCSLEKTILFWWRFPKKVVSLLVFNFVTGIIILTYTKTISHFAIHLICLTLNIIITLYIGREYALTILSFDDTILKNIKEENIELRQNYKRFRQKAFHPQNLLFCIIVLFVFFWGIFSQNYIKLDVVGCYAVYIVSLTVSASVIGYVEYLWLLWFLYRVSKCSCIPYNKMIPAYTPFLVKIGTLTNHAKWCFFIEGFLYVFEYFILIPSSNFNFSNINMPDNFSFLVTWAVIFVVIILAFPIIIFVQESLLFTIVNNLKTKRIEALSYKLNLSIIKNVNHISEMYMCNGLINSLITSPDYPVKVQRLGPTIVAVLTFVLHIVNLINQCPDLKAFLINRFL